ncbi:hypothetical protein BAO_4754 [Bacillus anthracis str. A0174]|nr:hypothetical protein BAO_4754 [Bacillus anthracis str. A0174]
MSLSPFALLYIFIIDNGNLFFLTRFLQISYAEKKLVESTSLQAKTASFLMQL